MGDPMLDIIKQILISGGSSAFVAFLIFKKFGNSWLDSMFAERLEAFRHEKAKEIERLKAEIDGSLKARVRFQEKQFLGIVEVWNLLREALQNIAASTSPLQHYSNVGAMTEDMRVEYLAGFDLLEAQRLEILSSRDPQKEFSQMIDRQNLKKAVNSFNEFNASLRAHEVFLDEAVYDKFSEICDGMQEVLIAKDCDLDDRDRKFMYEAWKKYTAECLPLVSLLAKEIRAKVGASLQA
jgi:hypothetical protein